MKLLFFILVLILTCFGVNAQSNIVFNLAEFNAIPSAGRTVVLQAQSPFVGNQMFMTSDANGYIVTNLSIGVLYNGSIQAPPSRITFQIYLPIGSTGCLDATNYTAVGGVNTYPAGQVAPSIQMADGRYARVTNSAASQFYPLGANPSNYVNNTTLLNSSNSLQSQIVAGAVTLVQVTNVVNGQTNGLATLQSLTTTSNSVLQSATNSSAATSASLIANATNGLVGIGITNGLASIQLVTTNSINSTNYALTIGLQSTNNTSSVSNNLAALIVSSTNPIPSWIQNATNGGLFSVPVTATNKFAVTNASWWDISGTALAATNPIPAWVQAATNPIPTWIQNATNPIGPLITAVTNNGNLVFTNALVLLTNKLAYTNGNWWDVIGAALAATNPIPGWITSALPSVTNNGNIVFTNQINVLTNRVAYTNGNWWDINGAAQASTNPIPGWIQAVTNSGLVRTDDARYLASLTNGSVFVQATNGTAYGLTVMTNITLGNMTNILLSTNQIGILAGAGSGMEGTYVKGSVTSWTNLFNTTNVVILSGGNLYLQSNGVSMYQSSDGKTWTAVTGAAPVPIGSYGSAWNLDGVLLNGWIYATNLTAQMNAAVSNYTGFATTANLNSASNAIITYVNNATNGLSGGSGTNGTTVALNSWTTNFFFPNYATNKVLVLPSSSTNFMVEGELFLLCQTANPIGAKIAANVAMPANEFWGATYSTRPFSMSQTVDGAAYIYAQDGDNAVSFMDTNGAAYTFSAVQMTNSFQMSARFYWTIHK